MLKLEVVDSGALAMVVLVFGRKLVVVVFCKLTMFLLGFSSDLAMVLLGLGFGLDFGLGFGFGFGLGFAMLLLGFGFGFGFGLAMFLLGFGRGLGIFLLGFGFGLAPFCLGLAVTTVDRLLVCWATSTTCFSSCDALALVVSDNRKNLRTKIRVRMW